MARAASSTTRKVVKKTATKKSSSKSTKAKSTKKPVAKKTPDAKKSRTRAVVNKAKVKTTTSKRKLFQMSKETKWLRRLLIILRNLGVLIVATINLTGLKLSNKSRSFLRSKKYFMIVKALFL